MATKDSDSPVVINAQLEHQLVEALHGGERTSVVVDLTRRALTLRAKGLSVAEIAETEQVEVSTLEAWLASTRRAITPEEAQRILREEIPMFAIENTLHQVLAGDKLATRDAMKEIRTPKKSTQSKTTILVGVGTGPVGRDPLDVRVAVAITQK